jgi:lipase
VTLALREWGSAGSPRVVCLHGVTGHGRHFARLGEQLSSRFHVVAPDLLGHGDSRREPPWSLAAHVDAVLDSVGREPGTWIGHSFGARVAFEIAAWVPGSVERLVLLDPAIALPPHVALFAAEGTCPDRSYASFAEALDRRYEESSLHSTERAALEAELETHLVCEADGRWRYRYCQSAVIAAYSDLAAEPPPFESALVPTLLVLGAHSYLSYAHLLDAHRAALGDLLQVVTVDGGHTVLLDAFDQTAAAIESFLAGPGQTGSGDST